MKPDIKGVWNGSEQLIHFKPTPGTLIIFPGYLEHEYAVDLMVLNHLDLYIGIYKQCQRNGKRCLKRKNIQLYVKQYQKT